MPAEHEGSQRLVDLLAELQTLPKKEVPYLLRTPGYLNCKRAESGEYEEGEWVEEVVKMTTKTLWELTSENHYERLVDSLNFLERGRFDPAAWHHGNESGNSAYVNFSAFLARLFASDVANTFSLSALVARGAFMKIPPRLPEAMPAGYQYSHCEPYALAAVQWISYAGSELFEMCEKYTICTPGGRKQWDKWKRKFEVLAEAEYIGERSRRVMKAALIRMEEIEKEEVATNIVDHFGLLHLDDDGETYISNRPGMRGYVEPVTTDV